MARELLKEPRRRELRPPLKEPLKEPKRKEFRPRSTKAPTRRAREASVPNQPTPSHLTNHPPVQLVTVDPLLGQLVVAVLTVVLILLQGPLLGPILALALVPLQMHMMKN